MPEISRTHLRHISSLELALIRYTQVTCHIGTKQTQSTPYKDTRKRSVAQTTTYKKIGQIHRKEDTVLPQRSTRGKNTKQKYQNLTPRESKKTQSTNVGMPSVLSSNTKNYVAHISRRVACTSPPSFVLRLT